MITSTTTACKIVRNCIVALARFDIAPCDTDWSLPCISCWY